MALDREGDGEGEKYEGEIGEDEGKEKTSRRLGAWRIPGLSVVRAIVETFMLDSVMWGIQVDIGTSCTIFIFIFYYFVNKLVSTMADIQMLILSTGMIAYIEFELLTFPCCPVIYNLYTLH